MAVTAYCVQMMNIKLGFELAASSNTESLKKLSVQEFFFQKKRDLKKKQSGGVALLSYNWHT